MAVQIMQGGRPRFASGDQNSGTLAELTAAVGGYIAYFGTYSVDDAQGTVTQSFLGAPSPENVGQTVTRKLTVTGVHLTIALETTSGDGQPVVRTLLWTRVG